MEELAGDSQYSRGTTLRGAFVGWNRHSMDEKKRLTIPANWREIMGYPGYMYVMFSAQQDRLLTLIPPIEMEEKIKQLREGLRGNPGYKTALKFISENSEQVFFDAQGRIRIPDRLLSVGKLNKAREKVVMLGALDKIELWPQSLKPETEPVKVQDEAVLRLFDELDL